MRGWEKNIRRVVPYVPGYQPKNSHVIKLNTNENPYPPAPEVEAALRSMDCSQLRKYPDPTAEVLRDALARRYDVTPDQVFVGVGSDDVLAMSFLTFFNSEKPVLFPDITYSFYQVWAELFKIPYETVPLNPDFTLNPEDYFRENGGIIFPNPNAPTGLLLPMEGVEQILQANPDSIVIVDEAYIDFGGASALLLLEAYENLLVVQTFSKSRSMAGLRIGFALGSPALIQALNDVKYSYNSYTMNLPSLLLGTESVHAEGYFRKRVEQIIETREWSKKELTRLGFHFPDSMANFIFAEHCKVAAKDLYEAMKADGIYVRYFDQPRLSNYLRISIGTEEEMRTLFTWLEGYLQRR